MRKEKTMSEQTLQRFLSRLNEDAAFRESAAADPEGAFAAMGLSSAEQAALTTGDEDTLRRMTGGDVSGYYVSIATIIRYTTTYGPPRPTDTPGSGNGCGTNATHNCFQGG
jgi:hypothetical protein